jgi:hypothetical protein
MGLAAVTWLYLVARVPKCGAHLQAMKLCENVGPGSRHLGRSQSRRPDPAPADWSHSGMSDMEHGLRCRQYAVIAVEGKRDQNVENEILKPPCPRSRD